MEEKNPFDGIKTYDNYTHLLQLTGFIIIFQVMVSLAAAIFGKKYGLGLTPYESIIPALLVTGYISWAVLDGLGVSFTGAWTDWSRNVLKDIKKAAKYFSGYLLVLLLLMVALAVLWWALGDRMEQLMEPITKRSLKEDGWLQGVASISNLRFLVVLFGTCVAAPVVEEVFFRRIVFATLRLKNRFWFSSFWSSLLFGLFHGVAAPLVLPFGMYSCWVYEKERRLPVNIMLHSMVNLSMITLKVLT